MSNNSNNIYNILGKLAALQPTAQEKHAATVKAIYESVEAQGSIIEGVDSVQARLAQQFAESKIEEKAVSQAQQKFMGMVHAAQKGEKAASPEVAKVAKDMGKNDAEDFASTKHKGLPDHVEESGEACNECGMYESECSCTHTNEAEITRKPGVTTHRKTDFPGYPADDADDLDNLRGPGAGKRGRPRKHAAKVATGLGRGRPVKAKAPTFSKQADPFNRISGAVPKGNKGTVHTMAESMNTLGRRLIEGINFQKMAEETNQTIDELMNDLQNDIKEYKATGHCSDILKDFMQVHAHSKKQMADEAVAGIGQDLVTPQQRVAQSTPQQPGIMSAVKDVAQGAKNWIQGKPEQGSTYEEVTMEDELNELAKLAGLGEATRGEHIKQKDAEAEQSGKNKFTAFGQEFDTDKVEEEEETDEGNAFGQAVRNAKADGVQAGEKVEVGGKEIPVKESTEFDGNESSDFNISTNMSSDGDKNVTVSATGEHAATLLQMLRIAGLGSGDKAQELQAEPEVEVISIDGEEGVEEEAVDVAEPATEPANAPNETYGTIKNITTQGDDLNREKSQDPATANKAANPMTNAQRVLKSVAQLESKLAEEYESIKKVNK